jgi:hypothetical protein
MKRPFGPIPIVGGSARGSAGRPATRWGAAVRLRHFALALLVAIMAGSASFGAFAAHVPGGHLVEVGPVSEVHGFPVWYMDSNDLALELCWDHQDPMCNIPEDHVPDFGAPASFPDNFASEAFWMLAEATIVNSDVDAVLVLALEGAFANEDPADGDQVSFGRVRIRAQDLTAGDTYRVTHPYGVDTFVAANAKRNINSTEDVGIGAPGDFTGALDSRIGPFLQWDPAGPQAPPAGYIGDPLIAHPVVGSPFDTNFFRIEHWNGSEWVNIGETNLFSLTGKVAVLGGVGVSRATYSRTSGAGGSIDVFAASKPGKSIQVSGGGIAETAMVSSGSRYYAHVPFSGDRPSSVTVTNLSDDPPSGKTVNLVDEVIITRATYDASSGQLKIRAHSSDRHDAPTLTAAGLGSLTNGWLELNGITVPPSTVRVTSAAGGSTTIPVSVAEWVDTGAPPEELLADAGADQTVQGGDLVILNGNGSTGQIDSFSWVQLNGDFSVSSLMGAGSSAAALIAPNASGTVTFRLTVQGPDGSDTDDVIITVEATSGPAVPDAPVADAGANQSVAQGALVILNGANSSGNITSYSWTQTGGPTVVLIGDSSASAGFIAPSAETVLTFQLTVTGPGGSHSDSVTVTVQGGSGGETPAAPVANAGSDQEVAQGALVLLIGTGSTGVISSHSWSQTGGAGVALSGASNSTAGFIAPKAAGVLTFQLQVNGPGGSHSDLVSITVQEGAGGETPAAPIANAGPDQAVAQGATVNLNGTGSTGVIDSYSWAQTGGPSVLLTGAATATPSFTFPNQDVSLTFQLTVTGPGGFTNDTVVISAAPASNPQDLTVTRAEYKRVNNNNQWRVDGTSSAPGATITVYAGDTPGGPVIGTATVARSGAWKIAVNNSPVGPYTTISVVSSQGAQLLGVAVTQVR